jgi:hypothetical protein
MDLQGKGGGKGENNSNPRIWKKGGSKFVVEVLGRTRNKKPSKECGER